MNTYRNRNGSGFTLIELLVVIAIVGILLAAALPFIVGAGSRTAAAGEKRGTIVKAATEGAFCPTHEAELIRGGMNGGSGGFGTKPFHFTYTDNQASNVEAFCRSGSEVLIKYHRPFWVWAWKSGSDGVFLDSIEPAEASASPVESGSRPVVAR